MTDQPNASDDRTAELERRIADLERRSPRAMMQEGRSGLEEAFWAVMHTVFPQEARTHLRKAGREQLLAARVYLDRWIERLDEQEAEKGAGRPHEKIEIE
jgi:type II secretory pathway component PulJ